MPKVSKKELHKLYKDHKVQLLISKLVSDKLNTLNQIYDPKHGFRYSIVEEIVGDSSRPRNFCRNYLRTVF